MSESVQTNHKPTESLPTNSASSTIFDLTGALKVPSGPPVMATSALVNLLTAPDDPIVSDLITSLRVTMSHPEPEIQALAAATLRIVHQIQMKVRKRAGMSKAELKAEKAAIEAEQLEALVERIANALKIDSRLLRAQARDQGTAIKRQIVVYLVRKITGASFPTIAKCFCRDHSSIIHGYQLISQRLAQDEGGFRRFVAQLEQKIISSASATATEGAGLTGAGSLPQLAQVAA